MNGTAGSPADPTRPRPPTVAGVFTGRNWQATWVSCIGPSHESSGAPREDSVQVEQQNDCVIAAVSDGHGMLRAFRAHIGSELAVLAAVDVAKGSKKEWSGRRARDQRTALWLSDGFTREVVSRWRSLVFEHVADWPIGSSELVASGLIESEAETVDLDAADTLVAYGATLLVAMADSRRILVWQLGDGDILYAPDGQDCAPAVRGDPELSGNRTTSLCLPEAERHARSAVLRRDRAPVLMVLASDGFGNAMVADDWQSQLGADLHASIARAGFESLVGQLPEWAKQASVASGDDVTVVILDGGSRAASRA